MANWAILASGNGSNFEALALALAASPHRLCCLIGDRREARVFERAELLKVARRYVSYFKREKRKAEAEILETLHGFQVDLVVLAGFMRLLSPDFVKAFPNRIVNIHPALLPRHPGPAAIEESHSSADARLGITIHYVDEGVDSGPVIERHSFLRREGESLEQTASRIHALEHEHYPAVVRRLLDELDREKSARST